MNLFGHSAEKAIREIEAAKKREADRAAAAFGANLRREIDRTTPWEVHWGKPKTAFREFVILVTKVWVIGMVVALIVLVVTQMAHQAKAMEGPVVEYPL